MNAKITGNSFFETGQKKTLFHHGLPAIKTP